MTDLDSRLVRASSLVKLPVVTLAGEDVAQVKDVVYDASRGQVVAFTLAGRGLLSGPKKEVVQWDDVHGVGPQAILVADESALTPRAELDGRDIDERDVIGARVITDDGRELGTVSDLVIDVRQGTGEADAVGYQIDPSDSFRDSSDHVLLPLPDTLSVTGDNLVVPHQATEYVRNDLAGFGAAVEQFRAAIRSSS